MLSPLKISITENPKLQGYYEKALDELNKFFKREWVYCTPRLFIVDDRKTIDILDDKESPPWKVGWGWGRYAIFILNPENIEKESSHKYSDEDVYKLIKHELCHAFYSLATQKNGPRWLMEGLSLYVADQIDNYTKPEKFGGFLDNKNIYVESVYAVSLLAAKHGNDKLVEFINSLKQTSSSNFKGAFETFFEMELTYEAFNTLLKEEKV